jgi:predicted ArsR family transcriptional regulator
MTSTPTKIKPSRFAPLREEIRELLANRGPLSTSDIARAVKIDRQSANCRLQEMRGLRMVRVVGQAKRQAQRQENLWALRCWNEASAAAGSERNAHE